MAENWNNLKLFNREELLEMVPSWFKFKTEPWTHQIAAFLANISNDGFLDALDLGTGKTKVAIDTFRYYAEVGNKKNYKVLYICLSTAVGKMADEVKIHSDFTVSRLDCSKKQKWSRLEERGVNFFVVGYEGLRSLLTTRKVKDIKNVYDPKKGKYINKVTRRQAIDNKAITRLSKLGFDAIVLDESHVIKTSTSLIFRIIKKLTHRVNKRVLLTGTPFGNTLLDVWSQYYVVDKGDTYGISFTRFRDSYFKDVGYFGPSWAPTEDGKKFIEDNLYNYAIRYSEDEVDDLPPKVFRTLTYSLSKDQRREYDALYDGQTTELNIDIPNRGLGYREICNGFISKSDFVFKKNPKLDLLWDLISTIVDEHKSVIFFERTISRKIVEKHLKKKKVLFRSLHGGTKDKYNEYMSFQRDPKYRVMLAQIKSGGASIDLIAATYCIFYEHGGSIINYRQALKRIHRGGQTQRCFFYSLIGKNTIERSIYRDLSNGNDAFTSIVDGETAKRYIKGDFD